MKDVLPLNGSKHKVRICYLLEYLFCPILSRPILTFGYSGKNFMEILVLPLCLEPPRPVAAPPQATWARNRIECGQENA